MRTFILLCCTLVTAHAGAAQDAHTSGDQILSAAREFLTNFAGQQEQAGYAVAFELGELDDRLRMAHCGETLAAEFLGDPFRSTQPRVEVSCSGERPWRMFVSTSLTIKGNALVAARALGRGDRIGSGMIRVEPVVVNALRRQAIGSRKELIGLEMKRPVRSGTVFTPDLVISPDAVSRGDHVVIIARSGTFQVKSRGKALADGRIGDQVLIENLSSQRRIRAMITGPGEVEIPM